MLGEMKENTKNITFNSSMENPSVYVGVEANSPEEENPPSPSKCLDGASGKDTKQDDLIKMDKVQTELEEVEDELESEQVNDDLEGERGESRSPLKVAFELVDEFTVQR